MKIFLLLLSLLTLAACGQSGALYLPDQGAKHKKTAKTAPATPAPDPGSTTSPQTPPAP